jgi:hypothetical protein
MDNTGIDVLPGIHVPVHGVVDHPSFWAYAYDGLPWNCLDYRPYHVPLQLF